MSSKRAVSGGAFLGGAGDGGVVRRLAGMTRASEPDAAAAAAAAERASDLLSRVRAFLPAMDAANKALGDAASEPRDSVVQVLERGSRAGRRAPGLAEVLGGGRAGDGEDDEDEDGGEGEDEEEEDAVPGTVEMTLAVVEQSVVDAIEGADGEEGEEAEQEGGGNAAGRVAVSLAPARRAAARAPRIEEVDSAPEESPPEDSANASKKSRVEKDKTS